MTTARSSYGGIFDFDAKQTRLVEVCRELEKPDIWSDAKRSQELGRRIQPLLALRPEQNRTVHVVQAGNTLGQIATKYRTTVAAVRKANQLKGQSLLQLGQDLVIPLRGACTVCPLPPPMAVPPRLVPPEPLPSVAQSWLGGINPEMATAE